MADYFSNFVEFLPESAFAGCFFGHRGHLKTNNGRPLPRPKAKIIALRRFLCYKGRRIVTLDVGVMIIDSSNTRQRNILTNKCFYQTTAQIMHDFEQKGYANSADETLKVINAYHSLIKKKVKNNFNADYNAAFQKIDDAIKMLANKVYYEYDRRSYDEAYRSFEEFDYVNAIIGRQRIKKSS